MCTKVRYHQQSHATLKRQRSTGKVFGAMISCSVKFSLNATRTVL
jgi:hypothetical protein